MTRVGPDPDDVEGAAKTLRLLNAQAAAVRVDLAILRGELAKARDELKGVRAAQLKEADEQLVLAAEHADSVAQTVVSSLGELTHYSQHDELTGAANRTLMLDRLEGAIALAKRHGTRVGVLFVDLDRFKQINDSLGHAVGDEVLRLVTRRLQSAVRDFDTVGRQSGDEFLVLLAEISSAGDAASVAQKMLSSLAVPARVGPHTLDLSASVGIAVYPDDGADPESLIQRADAAMYRAKRRGPGTYEFHAGEPGDGEPGDGVAGASADAPRYDRRRSDRALAEHEARLRELSAANHELLGAAQLAQRLKTHAEEAHQRQINFVAKAAHAMRTPLSVIMMTAASLTRAAANPGKSQEVLRRHAGHLARLLDDLLDGSLVGGGEFRLDRGTLDVQAIVGIAVDACRHAMDAKRQRLHLQPSPLPLVMHGDSMRLTQVFSNLLNNALRRAPEGGDVFVTTSVAANMARIAVSDNGAGISPELLPRIFDLFVLDTRGPIDDPGLGIGMAVVKELVRAHGGSVEASSIVDRPGAEFVVQLPLLDAAAAP